MTSSLWFLTSIFLWLLHNSNAGSRVLNKKRIHYTNIGDISPKDILRMANEATPADKRFLNQEPVEDPIDNKIVTERNQFYQNNNPDLDSPKDQERKFVNLLKKQYQGIFPEYGKETEADYSRNQELDDNLNVQPETALLGYSDMFHGKRGGNGDNWENGDDVENGGFHDPDGDSSIENLDSFESDSNLLNSYGQDKGHFHGKINNPTKAASQITARHHAKQATDEKVGNGSDENDDLSEGDEGASGTIGDKPSEIDEEQEMDKAVEKPKNTEDKMEEEIMKEDMENKSLQKVLHDNKKEKAKEIKKKRNKKRKSNKEQDSYKILQDFNDLKSHNKKEEEIKDSQHIVGTVNKPPSSHKHQTGNGNKINYIHAEDSQGTGDAILDFLDKLLEKDPKKLRHDVLSMANEMRKEETDNQAGRTASPVNENQDFNPKKQRRKFRDGLLKSIDEGKEVDKWISALENKNDAETEADAAISQSENEADSFDNEEYNEYHESQDIYPDHNGDETTLSEPAYDGLDEKRKREQEKRKKAMEVKQKEEFDYEEFKEEALKMHNEFRRRHNDPALEWSEELAKRAHDIAKQLTAATRNSFKRELEKHGQSIAILPYSTKHIAKSAVQKWYSEITKFSFANPDVKPETRDFTQVIWSGSKRLGMGFAHSENKKKTLVVALYSPAGNNRKDMRKNLSMVNYDLYADIRKAAIERHG